MQTWDVGFPISIFAISVDTNCSNDVCIHICHCLNALTIIIIIKPFSMFLLLLFRDRSVPGLDTVVPLETTSAYDMKDIVLGVSLPYERS